MKNKYVAALLAFFIGGLGFHKFYLGQTAWGVIYLIFFWTFIPAFAAFVEGILLLVTSEENFDRRFNGGAVIQSLPVNNPIEQAMAIEKLAELQAKGLISDEEFEAKRRQFLDRM